MDLVLLPMHGVLVQVPLLVLDILFRQVLLSPEVHLQLELLQQQLFQLQEQFLIFQLEIVDLVMSQLQMYQLQHLLELESNSELVALL